MATKNQFNAKEFKEALEAIEEQKGISHETVLKAFKDAMIRGYRKQLGGDDAVVEFNIDLDNGTMELAQVKDIVDDVTDDFLQIEKEDAEQLEKEDKGYIVEDKFYIPASIKDLRTTMAMSVKAIMKTRFSEAEKEVILEAFKDKIGTMITGKVEKVDDHGVSVNIGRTSVYVNRKELIGDEKFKSGDTIRLFVDGVESNSKGARIVVSRSSAGFLKCLFTEEIREIYDGTIMIKALAREAGERSKMAVSSNNPDVDPAGACIGQNGSRIQKIVSQLGNGTVKEKIDIIAYSDNPSLYVMEALKPAHVLGVNYDSETRTAIAVVKDDEFSLAIGRRGVNVRLAAKLTGIKIDIKLESDAVEEGFEYKSFEQVQAEEVEKRNQAILLAQQEALRKASEQKVDVLPTLPEGYVAPQQRVYEEEKNDFDLELENEDEDIILDNEKEESKENHDDEVMTLPAKEEEKPVVEAKEEEPVEKQDVKTTTTLSDLEKSLEEDNKKHNNYSRKSRKSAKKEEEEDNATPVSNVDSSKYMSIYTDEELKEMEEEENQEDDYDDSDEDIDYDEYDDYYDDEK